MRRWILVTLMLGGMAGWALPAWGESLRAADDFESNSYGGSTGSSPWSGPWQEVGESDGPGAGAVTVASSNYCASGSCAKVEGLLSLTSLGLRRTVDLGDAVSATLSYRLNYPAILFSAGRVDIEVEAADGTSQRLTTYRPGQDVSGSHDISAYISRATEIRMVASGLSLQTQIYLDDVEVEWDLPEPTTTTTTTTTSTTSTTTTTTTTTPPGRASTTSTTQPTAGTVSTTSTTQPTGSRPTTTITPPPTGGGTARPTTTTVAPVPPGTQPAADGPEVGPGLGPAGPGGPSAPPPPGEQTDEDGQPGPRRDGPQPPDDRPTRTLGVVTDLSTGLDPGNGLDLDPLRGLLAEFRILAEEIALELVGSLILGLVLAWASVSGLDRRSG